MINHTEKEERMTVSTVYFLNQGEGLYTKEIRTIQTVARMNPATKEKEYKKTLLRRVILARYRVVKRSEKYHVLHINQYTKKKIYLRRIS